MSTFGNMYTGTAVAPGQYEKRSAGSVSWKVPDGVTSISAVVIDAPTAPGTATVRTAIRRGATTILSGGTALGSGVGGGNGGLGGGGSYVSEPGTGPGEWGYYFTYHAGGGGGAGGYTGDGGSGRTGASGDEGTVGGSTDGSGGSGGRGYYDFGGGFSRSAESGYGTGLLGIGVAVSQFLAPGGGLAGVEGDTSHETTNVPNASKDYATTGSTGGNLRWKNDIPVTPGETLTLYCDTGGGLRVMWGGGRSYPSNAGNM